VSLAEYIALIGAFVMILTHTELLSLLLLLLLLSIEEVVRRVGQPAVNWLLAWICAPAHGVEVWWIAAPPPLRSALDSSIFVSLLLLIVSHWR
jgi:hypothetical protein